MDPSQTCHGIAHGISIELFDDLGIPEGARIAIKLQSVEPPQQPAPARNSSAAGAWADFPEMDDIMAAIERGRADDPRSEAEL